MVYNIRGKEYFKWECIEEASKVCHGKPRIYYFVEDIGENKLWGEFEANRLSDISKYFLVVDWCNIEDFGLAMLMGHVRGLTEAYLRLNKAMRENWG